MNTSRLLIPDFGKGFYRRRILLVSAPGTVSVVMEDDFHGFSLVLVHDGDVIVDVKAESRRVPGSTCGEATALLHDFAGRDLTADRAQFRAYANPRTHCTHLYDLLWLGCAHALRPLGSRQYDVTVPDSHGADSEADVRVDGTVVHRWTVDMSSIISPPEYAGRPLQQGFARWAASAFSGDIFEAACVLQMGVFVGRGRRLTIDALPSDFVPAEMPHGAACYSFQPETRLRYVRTIGAIRDFSATPERLLQFV